MTDDGTFVPAAGIEGPHAQTVWASLVRPRPSPPLRRETWEAPDGDALDLELLPEVPGAPGLLVLHGLEGSSRAKYVRGLLAGAHARGWNGAGLNFRSCGPTPHRHARTYHSGFTEDLDHAARRLRARWGSLAVAGFSLGGNVVLKWLGESGAPAPADAAVAVSVPFDLARAAGAIDSAGLWSLLYRERFLRSLRRKALATARRHPGCLDVADVRSVRSFAAFDGVVTARLHGFRDASDYWERCSSARFLRGVRAPTLLIQSEDDPIVPGACIPRDASRNPAVELRVTPRGGHVGFVGGSLLRPRYVAEEWALAFLENRLGARAFSRDVAR